MVEAAHCEAILRGYSKKRDREGDWIEVRFQLSPFDIPKLLNDAGLGTRFMLALAEIGDDETPVSLADSTTDQTEWCGNCDMPFPPGCEGNFQKDGNACLINRQHIAEKPKGGRRAREAGIACGEEAFQKWFGGHEADCANGIRSWCSVASRAELDHNEAAGKKWDALYTRYLEETGRLAEKRG